MELQAIFIAASFFFFFLLSAIPSFVYSQSDSCSSNLNLNGFVPFDTTSLHCDLVWDAEDYILRTGQNLWSFVLSAPYTDSYIAIGFSPDGSMEGSSAMVGWTSMDGGGGMVKQYYLGGTTPTQVIPNQGKLVVVHNSSTIVYRSPSMYMAFQLNITDPGSHLIYSVGPRNWLPASDFRLTEHRNKISTSWNYVSGQSSNGDSNGDSDPYSRLRKAHGALVMIGWGILMIIGVIIARYFRQWEPFWFYSHVCIQLSAFIIGLTGVILGFILEDRLNESVSKHKALGIIILVLGCLQPEQKHPNQEAVHLAEIGTDVSVEGFP
ncbi:hypothetical protein NE237_014440 [Protea cynaroides]|uniref:Cytochrome b561 and DOMON domain-containing protein n=1 Tax=Protea cynaroides TaxID=273540 RepID=A0A9Q0QQ98_9MAGN|nr:hypothetical protein NE237_014440 [Protea cynaroides]